MKKMYCDNSFGPYFGLKNKEIHLLYIEATILEQNQNQKKKRNWYWRKIEKLIKNMKIYTHYIDKRILRT